MAPVIRRALNSVVLFQIGEVFHHKAHPAIHHALTCDAVRGYSRMLANGDAIGGAILRSNELFNDAVLQSTVLPQPLKFDAVAKAADLVHRADGIGTFNLGMYKHIATSLVRLPLYEDARDVPIGLWAGPVLLCLLYVLLGGGASDAEPVEDGAPAARGKTLADGVLSLDAGVLALLMTVTGVYATF